MGRNYILALVLILISLILFWVRKKNFFNSDIWNAIVDVATIVPVIAAIATLIIFNQIPPNPTPTYTPTFTPTYTSTYTQIYTPKISTTYTPTYTPTNTPTFTPTNTPTFTPTPISYKVDISFPTDNDIENLESIWLLVPEDTQIKIPGRKSYTANINSNEKRLWMFYWCATNPGVLEENLNYIKTTFLIDGNTVPTEKIREYDKFLSKNEWYCHYWSIKLHNWEPSSLIKLEIGIKFTRSIVDNISSYPAGLYSLILDIFVE